MLLVKMGSLLEKVCVEKGRRLPLWPEKLLLQLIRTHLKYIYPNNDKHSF